ncbi:MAG: hypothetical protein AB7S68_35145 [Polyangiaceae bacterium]
MAGRRRNRRPQATLSRPESERDVLLTRVRRLRRRGDQRKAMLALRDAAFDAGDDASLWTLYADQCIRAGKADRAEHALTQALWLRERNHDYARAAVTRRLLNGLRQAA